MIFNYILEPNELKELTDRLYRDELKELTDRLYRDDDLNPDDILSRLKDKLIVDGYQASIYTSEEKILF